MKKSLLLNTTFAIALGICPAAFGSAGQSVKKAGQTVGHAVETGARKVVHKSAKDADKGATRVKSKTKS